MENRERSPIDFTIGKSIIFFLRFNPQIYFSVFKMQTAVKVNSEWDSHWTHPAVTDNGLAPVCLLDSGSLGGGDWLICSPGFCDFIVGEQNRRNRHNGNARLG